MFFSWLKKRKRRQIRAAAPLDEWRPVLGDSLWQFTSLTDAEQDELCRTAAVIVAEKHWEGCQGLKLTAEMQLITAAQVAMMTLGFGEQYFDRVRSVLLYPEAYEAPTREAAGGGFVVEGKSARIGEAWYRGPVILSWPDIEAGGHSPNHGHNLVVHEFAHQLDTLNGREADGVPVIERVEQADRWIAVRDEAYKRLQRSCRGGRPHFDCYGATNHAEFFAVSTESFFQTPTFLAQVEPELFALMRQFYGQDPRRWDR